MEYVAVAIVPVNSAFDCSTILWADEDNLHMVMFAPKADEGLQRSGSIIWIHEHIELVHEHERRVHFTAQG